MVKMQCRVCRDIMFSAATDNLSCSCGGRFQIIPFEVGEQIIRLNDVTKELFNFSGIESCSYKQKYN